MRARRSPSAGLAVTSCLLAVASSFATPRSAHAVSFEDVPLFNEMFGDGGQGLTITDAELSSLGCIVAGTATALAAALLGGTAAIVTGGTGTATAVAIPVIAGSAAAGCAFGASAAPGVVWLGRNGDQLFRRLGDTLPSVPELPVPSLK